MGHTELAECTEFSVLVLCVVGGIPQNNPVRKALKMYGVKSSVWSFVLIISLPVVSGVTC